MGKGELTNLCSRNWRGANVHGRKKKRKEETERGQVGRAAAAGEKGVSLGGVG